MTCTCMLVTYTRRGLNKETKMAVKKNKNKLLLLAFAICRLIITVGLTVVPIPTEVLLRIRVEGEVSVEGSEIEAASMDFGRLSRGDDKALAVVRPTLAEDVIRVVKAGYEWRFAVSARGHGHSINGQAVRGVVIEMGKGRGSLPKVWEKEMYVDVWGGELWIEVLRETLQYGLAPMSWTDYLYLSVGGTLSNAGISGQTFNHGPQISNVYELDVVTGTK